MQGQEAAQPELQTDGGRAELLSIALMAMGGEGGGVLVDWLVDAAEHAGFIAQATSVPGVAQRTGATIYYVELFPRARSLAEGAEPVLALMPAPGDVDVVLASELMEAARAVVRGFVAPSRTTLIGSTHRVYSMAEKTALGDGRVDSDVLLREVRAAARRVILFDMQRLAREHGSVISAVLFGALAGADVLPFGREVCEDSIRRGGVGVDTSLAAFAAAYARARQGGEADAPTQEVAAAPQPPPALAAMVQGFDPPLQPLITAALTRLVDYQDLDYARLYLARLQRVARLGATPLTEAVARHLALWMSYEDAIRVADLKTRSDRAQRVAAELKVQPQQILQLTEYLHPRLQEVADILPAPLARRLLRAGWLRRWADKRLQRGRTVSTTGLRGFLLLYALAGLRPWRRLSLRFREENARIEAWLAAVERAAGRDVEVAREIALCPRLLKGYGETLERGRRHFERIMALLADAEVFPAACTVRDLREAALADDEGRSFAQALQRHGLAEAA